VIDPFTFENEERKKRLIGHRDEVNIFLEGRREGPKGQALRIFDVKIIILISETRFDSISSERKKKFIRHSQNALLFEKEIVRINVRNFYA